MESTFDKMFVIPYLSYNYSLDENDKNITKPFLINFHNNNLKKKLKTHCKTIKMKLLINGKQKIIIITDYKENQIEKIASIIRAEQEVLSGPECLTELHPWCSVEQTNLETNNVYKNTTNSVIYNRVKRNIVCRKVLNLLNFFDLAKLQRVASVFYEPIHLHLHKKYSLKKSELFEKFNLRVFLNNIDNESYNGDTITIYQLRFIFKHFGHHMRKIIIQLEYIKMNMNLNDLAVESIINTISEIVNEFTDDTVLQLAFIDKKKIKDNVNIVESPITTEEVSISHLDKFDNFLGPLNCYDMQTNPNLINHLCFTNLVERKNVNNLKMLTAYPHLQVDRLFLIEFLNKIKLESFDIQGTNHITENQDCDDLINALLVNSRESLKSIKITSCRSVNIFRLINQFINLEELIITNLNIGDIHYAKLLKLSKLRILKLPNNSYLNDNICYEVYKKNKSLEYLDISKCDITGEFLEALNLEYDSGKLVIDITDTRAASLHSRDEIFITNEKLIIKNRNFKCYEDWEIKEIMEQITSDAAYSQTNQFKTCFVEKIRSFLNNLTLDLTDYFHFDQNCFNYITSFKKIDKLCLTTYYTMVGSQMDMNKLNHCRIQYLTITGFDKFNQDNPKNSSDFIFKGLSAKLNNLLHLEITGCSIGHQFTEAINKCINLQELKLSKVQGLSLQDFNKWNLPQLKSLDVSYCHEFDDRICYYIVKNCPKLDDLKILKCDSFKRDFINDINSLPHGERLLNINIYSTPSANNFVQQELQVKNISIKIDFDYSMCYNMFVSLFENDYHKKLEKRFFQYIKSLDLKLHSKHKNKPNWRFNNIFFENMRELRQLKELTMESYYPFAIFSLLSLSKLKIEKLSIINDNICEIDWSCDILEDYATYYPYLRIIVLKKCKIYKSTILSLNKLVSLNSLSLVSMEFENQFDITKLLLKKQLKEIAVIDADIITNEACIKIISDHYNLTYFNLTKCKNITEEIFTKLRSSGIKMKKNLKINITCTPASYYWLFNPVILSANITFQDNIDDAKYYYLEKILTEKCKQKNVPCRIIDNFNQCDSLDLTKLKALDDLSFDYISQLNNLGEIKICSRYKNVQNRDKMINNLLKINFKLLTLIGNEDDEKSSDCSDIIEKLAYESPYNLLEITFINCKITSVLIENIQRFTNLQKFTISNDNKNYLNIIMEEFNFNGSSVYQLTVNDTIIDNNLDCINTIKEKISRN